MRGRPRYRLASHDPAARAARGERPAVARRRISEATTPWGTIPASVPARMVTPLWGGQGDHPGVGVEPGEDIGRVGGRSGADHLPGWLGDGEGGHPGHRPCGHLGHQLGGHHGPVLDGVESGRHRLLDGLGLHAVHGDPPAGIVGDRRRLPEDLGREHRRDGPVGSEEVADHLGSMAAPCQLVGHRGGEVARLHLPGQSGK